MSADIEEQYDKIYRYCYFKTQNAALAEDLTQECFLKYISQNTYVERGKELAYLYTIARNLCMDTFRRKAFVPLDENAGTEEVLLHRAELKLCVRQALCLLSYQEQELLLLRYAEQLSVKQISAITGLSRFAVYRKSGQALDVDFSLFRPSPFFVDPKNGDGRNNNPPAMRVRVDCYTKKLPFRVQ